MIYLDTSAFLKLYIREDGSDLVAERVTGQDEPVPVWELLEAEFINALRLKIFWGEISVEQADGQIELFEQRMRRGQYFFPELHRGELMAAFQSLSRETATIGCRTLDIFHVACALQLSPSSFLTFDDRQRALARHAGLAVVPDA